MARDTDPGCKQRIFEPERSHAIRQPEVQRQRGGTRSQATSSPTALEDHLLLTPPCDSKMGTGRQSSSFPPQHAPPTCFSSGVCRALYFKCLRRSAILRTDTGSLPCGKLQHHWKFPACRWGATSGRPRRIRGSNRLKRKKRVGFAARNLDTPLGIGRRGRRHGKAASGRRSAVSTRGRHTRGLTP